MPNRNRSRSHTSRYPRTARVNELLREMIAETLEREVDDDPRLELVTITGVEAENDLRAAVVYFSALDTKASLDEVVAGLEQHRISMQKTIARGSTFKRTPLLKFVPDAGIIEGQRIEGLIHTLPPATDQPDLDGPDSPYNPSANDVK